MLADGALPLQACHGLVKHFVEFRGFDSQIQRVMRQPIDLLAQQLALLPGAIFHPEGAEEAIAAVVLAARARGIPDGALLDALLRMELSLRTLSRVKPAYAYRAEALAV